MDNYRSDNNAHEFNRLISELTQGRDLVHQLQLHLNSPNYNSTENTREFLLHNIQSKFDRALSLLQYNSSSTTPTPTGDNSNSLLPHSNSPAIPIFGTSDSPRSSEDSDRDLEPKDHHATTRKRKSSTPRWTKQVQIHPGAPIEGTLDDGYSWRKYGQKDILGAKYPRGYYRCTLRHVQGCLATKQVQRSDEDPTIFEVTYRGRHTCNQGGGASSSNVNPTPPPLALTMPQNQEPKIGNHEQYQQLIPTPHENPQEILLDFQKNLSISKDDFSFSTHHDHPNNVPYIPSFDNFPSSSSHVHTDHQDYNFLANSSTIPNNNFVEDFPPSFNNMSGGTSQQNGADYQFNTMGFESNFPNDYQGFSS